MRLLSCYDVFSGCAWYRATVPFYEAANQGHEVSVVQGGIPRAGVEQCDVLQVQRIWHPEGMEAVKRANALGKLTVYDIDDDLWSLGPENSAQAFWQEHGDFAAKIMRECRVVTTTTERFATFLRTMHPDVRVVPNCLPDSDWPLTPHVENDRLVIGWAGGSTHRNDLGLIADALRYTVEHHDVTVALLGANGDWVPYHPRIHQWYPVAIEDYPHAVAGFDIGVAPLTDTRFNRHKSDLKPLEYAACGIPCIASPLYADTPSIIARDRFADWTRKLDALITDAQYRKQQGELMQQWAQTRMMSRNLATWEAVWATR